MNKIESIKIVSSHDEDPDVSWLGEYTDDMEPGVIIREYDEFYEKIPTEMERDLDGKFIGKMEPEISRPGNTFRGFKPYAGDETVGTKDYYKYGMQDYERMEGLNRGDWCIIGIKAEAVISYPTGNNGDRRIERLTSGGLWGIESDSGGYLQEVAQNELIDLKFHLENFNIDTSNWKKLTKDLELED
jgi:hypothetical protein